MTRKRRCVLLAFEHLKQIVICLTLIKQITIDIL